MLQEGQIVSFVESDSVAAAAWLPSGSRSQVLHYYTKDLKIKLAVVHQYVLPDGSLGASGMPDPKWLFDDGIIYAAERKAS